MYHKYVTKMPHHYSTTSQISQQYHTCISYITNISDTLWKCYNNITNNFTGDTGFPGIPGNYFYFTKHNNPLHSLYTVHILTYMNKECRSDMYL